MRAAGEAVAVEGMSAWTDAALLNEAGIPAVCFGPGDISLAHAAEEYIPLDEIDRADRGADRHCASLVRLSRRRASSSFSAPMPPMPRKHITRS